jgi:hypothetical protein
MATDQASAETGQPKGPPPPGPRSPLIIGGIAIGLIAWMFLVVMLLIGWKLFS